MHKKFKGYKYMTIMVTAAMLAGCAPGTSAKTAVPGTQAETKSKVSVQSEGGEVVTKLSKIDMTKWQYNAEDKVYYQIGLQYCETPADLTYETLSIFVPAPYMDSKDNGDGTFTCQLNAQATVGNYTAQTAPIVIPVETPGYSACTALTEYKDFSDYTDAGFVYVFAGCRGRDQDAPTGVTDLKAAIRYIRYNDGVMAGNMNRIFSFGMSGGGAQSALLGATGDSSMYDSYLQAIGAVQGISDAVTGSMCWCPITELEAADAAYEWNMGATRTGLSEEEQQISNDLTAAFAEYINTLGIKDEAGNVLKLEQSADGRYQAGTYYEYIKGVIEDSLNNFLSDTVFPYDADAANSKGGMMGGMMGGPGGKGNRGGKDNAVGAKDNAEAMKVAAHDTAADGAKDNAGAMADPENKEIPIEERDNISRQQVSGNAAISGTYETPQDYIDALNAGGNWVSYDAASNTAKITSIEDFAKAVKPASKGLGAFDQLDAGQGENTLFGYGDGKGAHFDSILAEILKGTEYEAAYSQDLAKEDAEGNKASYRVNMYSPLYYLMASSEGYETSNTAKYWRIRTGAWQSDTSLTTEINLALALENYKGVDSVDFETVWGQKHTKAERTGSDTENFIKWVNECTAAESR